MYSEIEQINSIITDAKKIVIIQADNPDADSLGSALALEHILGDLGKEVVLYCAVDMPSYLRYLSGWDRVQNDLPQQFSASIIVDASTVTLLDKLLQRPNNKASLVSKPTIVLDHHSTVDKVVPFATVMINDAHRASTGELIYQIASQLKWPMSCSAQEFIMSSILGDTQGLTNQLASAETYRIMADMIESGVDRPNLEDLRRKFSKMPPSIYRYKASLIEHTDFAKDDAIAYVMVPQVEINEYSPLYNPAPLIQGDMLQIAGVMVSIVFKRYDDGKITAAIRCNPGAPIAADLAEQFGGGGHKYASGFKVVTSRPFNEIKSECIDHASHLLDQLKKEQNDEIIQYSV